MTQEDIKALNELNERAENLEKRIAELEAKWPPATHEMLVELFKQLHKAERNRGYAVMEMQSVLSEIEAAALQVKFRGETT